jgi:hypothetical protein
MPAYPNSTLTSQYPQYPNCRSTSSTHSTLTTAVPAVRWLTTPHCFGMCQLRYASMHSSHRARVFGFGFRVQVEAQDRTQSYVTFEFAQYLAICHDTCVAAVVQVPSSAWVILLVGLGPLRAFIQIIDTKVKLAIFSSTGYILLLLSFVIYFKLKKIRFKLIGVPDPDPSLVKKDATLFDKIVSTHTTVFDDVNHAPFTQTELQLTTYPRRSWWRVLFKVVNMPNKQQSLFWCDRLRRVFPLAAYCRPALCCGARCRLRPRQGCD